MCSLKNSSATLDLEGVVRIYTGIKEQYKSFKEGEHSKTKTLMYGLIAAAIFCLFTGNLNQSLLSKFILTCSIPVTLLAYYLWFISDAVIFHVINICDWLIEFAQKLSAKNETEKMDPTKDPLFQRILYCKEAYTFYIKLDQCLSWVNLLLLLISCSMVILGIFWINFSAPSLLQQIPNEKYPCIFYWVIFLIVASIIVFQIWYNKIIRKYPMSGSR